jgi:DNA primase
LRERKNWVDFRQLRETVDFGALLEAYGVTLNLRGEQQHQGFCPLPNHHGQKRSPSFSAHLGKKAFHCFGCGAKGNAIDFVALMEGLNPDDPKEIRKAGLLIQERFLNGEPTIPPPEYQRRSEPPPEQRNYSPPEAVPSPRSHTPRPQRRNRLPSRPSRQKTDSSLTPSAESALSSSVQPDNRTRVVNAPLDFELKSLDPNHPYLQKRGLTPETIRTFGLGYCSKGLMTGRIAIPLRNPEGYLIGYAGRLVDDSQIGEQNPKYRLPGTRERDGTVYEFSKGAFLFNANRIEAPASDLIVVEGFFSVFHLHQRGWPKTVALMGSSCSPEQAGLILRLTAECGRIWLMPDGDKAGIKCAEGVLTQVAPHRLIRWIKLDEGNDPCDYTRETLVKWLPGSI